MFADYATVSNFQMLPRPVATIRHARTSTAAPTATRSGVIAAGGSEPSPRAPR